MKKMTAAMLCLFCLAGCAKQQEISTEPVLITEGPDAGVLAEVPVDEITCVAPVVPTDPASMTGAPELTVFCSGAEVNALYGGHTWVTTMSDGTAAVICADSMHPLEMQKYLNVLETAQDTAGLTFWDGETQVFPREIHVTAREFDCTPDCDGQPYEVEVFSGGEMVELLPGKYIYIVNTGWGDGETSGGHVTHVFAAELVDPNNE